MPNYSAGTLTITDGSELVTGAGTAFLANVAKGSPISIDGLATAYQVAAVTDDTHLVLSRAIRITGDPASTLVLTEQTYTVCPDFTPNLNLPLLSRTDADRVVRLNRALTLIDRTMAATLVKQKG